MNSLIWFSYGKLLSFKDWLIKNDDDLICMMAESGTDRESDYDYEDECQKIYDEGSQVAQDSWDALQKRVDLLKELHHNLGKLEDVVKKK